MLSSDGDNGDTNEGGLRQAILEEGGFTQVLSDEDRIREAMVQKGKRILSIFLVIYLVYTVYIITNLIGMSEYLDGTFVSLIVVRDIIILFLLVQLINGRQWARIVIIAILAFLIVFRAVNDFEVLYISLLMNGSVIGVLIFNKYVKAVFANAGKK